MTDGFSGSVLVTRRGKTVLEVSAGMADVDTGTFCTADTRYQIASVSKQFTAASVMLLAEEGALRIDDPLPRWLPDCPAAWRHLTVHQLLSHTSGLGHWGDLPGFDIQHPGDTRAYLEGFAQVPLRSTPGTTWHYSSPGYLLAAQIVERAAGQKYADFLTERVLEPLGMHATRVGEAPPERFAHGYRNRRRVDVAEFAAMPGAGDLWSTVGDLARYTAAFTSGDLLTARSRAAMTTAHASLAGAWGTDGPAIAESYGYGYALGALAGHPAHFHGGDNPGYQSFLGRLADLDVTVVILSNTEDSDRNAVLRRLLPAILDG